MKAYFAYLIIGLAALLAVGTVRAEIMGDYPGHAAHLLDGY